MSIEISPSVVSAKQNVLFLAKAAHELRAPVSAIIASARLCLDGLFGALNPELSKYLKIIHSNAEHELRLINDFLDALKLQEKCLTIRKSEFRMESLIHQVETTFQPLAIYRRQRFHIEVGPEVPDCLHGDLARLKQAVFNLLSNAFKFTPPAGAIHLKVSRENHILKISVQDEGPGILAEELRLIRQPYQQGCLAQNIAGKGFGLGLYIAEEIVRLHGGSLHIESQAGKGSLFVLSLPWERP
jgi:signal transduction histidine kinase